MKLLSIELKKGRRSGVFPVMLGVGLLGALYAFANFAVRKESLLSLPLPPMTILLTQLYGMIMVMNLFGIIVAACLIYNVEHRGNALNKMMALPISISGIYFTKFAILTTLVAVGIALQNIALAIIGNLYLPEGTFDAAVLLRFTVYSFVTSMPVLSFMLAVSSRFESMWITLGIGVAGFFSGMTMTTANSKLFLINPFVLIMEPAMSPNTVIDTTVIVLSISETIVFLVAGQMLMKHIRYE
ncbi:ABC-2 family transporter protein [Ruminiclostridium hungatei]|uniref:ABC-2 family transporter protein n=1 Tax=Ruminiclostridium hungatei TaxID=48256 RepID=A0A1V4SF59_RUMHU|nr:ABC transporter permease [Ruminiclostridium hungatei]OPX42552.1 ABC-2 family transporter protein [Ruminiclostridium hungatei]